MILKIILKIKQKIFLENDAVKKHKGKIEH